MCLPENPCRLLFVEDDELLINLLEAHNQHGGLSDFALDCTVARSLQQAVTLIRNARIPFDVISIDPKLPDSFGVDTFEVINKIAPDPPKFIYTGNVDQTFVDVVIRHGAERVLMKGEWSPAQYLTLLHYGAGQHRARAREKAERKFYKEESEKLAGQLSAIRNRNPQSQTSRELDEIIGNLKVAAAS
jgi:DNA-binding NtrC family response regulator